MGGGDGMEWEWRDGEEGTADGWLDDLFAPDSLCFGSYAGKRVALYVITFYFSIF